MGRRGTKRCVLLAAASLTTAIGAPPARAKSLDADDDIIAPTFSSWVGGGYSIYKSTLVQSNDTALTTRFGFGLYAGAERNLGMLLERESSKFTFKLNGSSLAVDWQDVEVRYRLGPVHAGVLISSTTQQAKAPPDTTGTGILNPKATAVDLISVVGTGYGMHLGAMFPVGRRSSLWFNAAQVSTTFVQSKAFDPAKATNAASLNTRTVTIGPRTDLDFGGSLGLTRQRLDAIAGFKMRSYSLTVESKAYKEQVNSTYLGLRAKWNF